MNVLASAVMAPKPEVHHLPTLFRRVQVGEIRVPAFQREFSWDESQVISLLDSVYRGYPIGSLLLWEVSESIFREEAMSDLPFPRGAMQMPCRFILDGLQRLASLYGVFHSANGASSRIFDVVFSLRDQRFRHLSGDPLREDDIPLNALFSPRDLLDHQKRLFGLADSELLVSRALALQSTFQEYLIPTVTISHRNVEEVVEIFRRINSTGTPLGAVDFMRALTWSGDFDLTQQLQAVARYLSKRNFVPSDETILKAVAISSGLAPVSEEMLALRGRPAPQLLDAVQRTERSLEKALDFLADVLNLRSTDFLPYEGQLLAVAKFFMEDIDPTERQARALSRWIWSSSFGEELRGKPDHYLARFLRLIDDLREGRIVELPSKSQISADVWIERRMIRGKALSSAYAAMFAKHGARSVFTGRICPPDSFLRRFDINSFSPIMEASALSLNFNRSFTSARVFANLLLLGPEDMPSTSVDLREVMCDLARRTGEQECLEILESQFFPQEASRRFLIDGSIRPLLEARAERMVNVALKLSAD